MEILIWNQVLKGIMIMKMTIIIIIIIIIIVIISQWSWGSDMLRVLSRGGGEVFGWSFTSIIRQVNVSPTVGRQALDLSGLLHHEIIIIIIIIIIIMFGAETSDWGCAPLSLCVQTLGRN